MSDAVREARAAADRTDGVSSSRATPENHRVSIRAVLIAAVITGFLLGAAEVQGHGAPLPRPAAPLAATG
ncbi:MULTISPECIES: hypothetical protein [unclassified Streptomyces]|nr:MULTISPECIES: hypothetical protein [unclassified Streptomyces]